MALLAESDLQVNLFARFVYLVRTLQPGSILLYYFEPPI